MKNQINEMKYKFFRKKLQKLEKKEGYTYSSMLKTKNEKWVKTYRKYNQAKIKRSKYAK